MSSLAAEAHISAGNAVISNGISTRRCLVQCSKSSYDVRKNTCPYKIPLLLEKTSNPVWHGASEIVQQAKVTGKKLRFTERPLLAEHMCPEWI